MGTSEEDALLAADVLTSADVRGIDSHEVPRLVGYVALWEAGRINAKPDIRTIREHKSTFTIDGDSGLGLVVPPSLESWQSLYSVTSTSYELFPI